MSIRWAICNRSHHLCDAIASQLGLRGIRKDEDAASHRDFPAWQSQRERAKRRPLSAASLVDSLTVTRGRKQLRQITVGGKIRQAGKRGMRRMHAQNLHGQREADSSAAGPSCGLSRPTVLNPHGTAPCREFKWRWARQLSSGSMPTAVTPKGRWYTHVGIPQRSLVFRRSL